MLSAWVPTPTSLGRCHDTASGESCRAGTRCNSTGGARGLPGVRHAWAPKASAQKAHSDRLLVLALLAGLPVVISFQNDATTTVAALIIVGTGLAPGVFMLAVAIHDRLRLRLDEQRDARLGRRQSVGDESRGQRSKTVQLRRTFRTAFVTASAKSRPMVIRGKFVARVEAFSR